MVINIFLFLIYFLVGLLIGIIINDFFMKIYQKWITDKTGKKTPDFTKFLIILIIELFVLLIPITIVSRFLVNLEKYLLKK